MSSLFHRFRAACITILVAPTVLGTMPAASAAEIVVFAAASLKEGAR
jgi:ABC-type molybdate transport system substrate-binding protein